jgi:dUTP pyrophosphatase
MKIKIIDYGYLHIPKRAHENDAGADVFFNAKEAITLEPHTTTKLPLGLGLEVPDGYAAYVFPRSGLASKGVVCELPPIDSGYRGEINAIVSNMSNYKYIIAPHERVGQLVVMPVVIVDYIDYDMAERGTGAFASTGR